jgi:hypothetical protein
VGQDGRGSGAEKVEKCITDLKVVSRKCIVSQCYKAFRINNVKLVSEYRTFSNLKYIKVIDTGGE